MKQGVVGWHEVVLGLIESPRECLSLEEICMTVLKVAKIRAMHGAMDAPKGEWVDSCSRKPHVLAITVQTNPQIAAAN